MTDYKEKADKLLNKIYTDLDNVGRETTLIIAILSQQRVVDELEYLKIKSTACNASDIFAGRLEYHQNLLKELMERL